MLTITHLDLLPRHRLHLTFSDGRAGVIDLLPVIQTELPAPFLRLLDETEFADVRLKNGTTTWDNDLDVAPEFLYYCTFRNEPDLQARFADWGYVVDPVTQSKSAHA